jgi:hypothetical protein
MEVLGVDCNKIAISHHDLNSNTFLKDGLDEKTEAKVTEK